MNENESIEIPLGTKDSELKGWEYTIPEGMEAEVKDGKIIVREKESEDERIRKELIKILKSLGEGKIPVDINYADIFTWLEKPVLPDFEEQEGVAGRDYIPVDWVEAIENYGKWKIVRTDVQNPAWSVEDEAMLYRCICATFDHGYLKECEWLKSLKERVQPQNK